MFNLVDSLWAAGAEREFNAAQAEFFEVVMPLLGSVIDSDRFVELYGATSTNEEGTTHYGEHIHAIPKENGVVNIQHTVYTQDLTLSYEHDETTHVVEVNTYPEPSIGEVRWLEHSPILHVDLEGAPARPVKESLLPSQAVYAEAAILRAITEILTSNLNQS